MAALQATSGVRQSPDELVQSLRQFQAAIPGVAPSNGVLPPSEQLHVSGERLRVHDRPTVSGVMSNR